MCWLVGCSARQRSDRRDARARAGNMPQQDSPARLLAALRRPFRHCTPDPAARRPRVRPPRLCRANPPQLGGRRALAAARPPGAGEQCPSLPRPGGRRRPRLGNVSATAGGWRGGGRPQQYTLAARSRPVTPAAASVPRRRRPAQSADPCTSRSSAAV